MTTYVVIMSHKNWLKSRVERKWTNRSYDDTCRHKGMSLMGYLTIRFWDLVVVHCLGTKKNRFLTDPREINDRLGTFVTWIIRMKSGNVGITKIFDSTGAVISSKKFSNFLLIKTICRKIGVSQSIFDPQTRSKACFRRSTPIWAQFAEK